MFAIVQLAQRLFPSAITGESTKPRPVQSRSFVHDRSQLELILTYPVLAKNNSSNIQVADRAQFEFDIYFAFPPQLQVNAKTYPKSKFYQDLACYTRLREPRLATKKTLQTPLSSKESPLHLIEKHIATINSGESNRKYMESATADVRLFACSYVSYFFRRTLRKQERLRSLLFKAQKTNKVKTLQKIESVMLATTELLHRAQTTLNQVRNLSTQFTYQDSPSADAIQRELKATDEYATYRFLDGIMDLSKTIHESPLLENHDVSKNFAKKLIAFYRLNRWYTKQQKYAWPELHSSRQERERYLIRKRSLKQRLWSVLYLEHKRKPFHSITNNIGAMGAAALAAAWALTANIFILSYIGVENLESSLTSLIGFNGFLAVTAVVLAYVLKDRLKDFGKANFGEKIFKNAPDYTNYLSYRLPSKRRVKIGKLSEQTSYIAASSLPDQVLASLISETKDISCAYNTSRKVLHYKKKVFLNPRSLEQASSGVKAVNDILRFNVERFLPRLDDPEEQSLTMARNGEVETIALPKVYYLDVLIVGTSSAKNTSNGQNDTICMDYVRLVMTKSGLSRIDYL